MSWCSIFFSGKVKLIWTRRRGLAVLVPNKWQQHWLWRVISIV